MPTFTVKEVLSSRPWPAPPEQPKRLYVDFKAEETDKVCNYGIQPGSELQVGQKIDATAEEDRGKLKLKPAGGNRGGGGPRPEDPKRQAIILRQHSQGLAVQTLALAQALGLTKPFEGTESVGDLNKKIVQLADFFDKDARRVAAQS